MSELVKSINEGLANARKNLKTILMDIGVIIVSISYVLYQLLTLKPADIDPLTLTAETLIGVLAGLLIKMGLGENGFTRGYQSDEWKNHKDKYNKRADMALPYSDKVEEFQERLKNERLIKVRRLYLSQYRIKYDDFYDSNGDFIERDIITPKARRKALQSGKMTNEDLAQYIVLDKKQIKALYKSCKIKVYIRELLNEYDSELSTYTHKEFTDKDQRNKKFGKNILSAAIIATVGVYFVPMWAWSLEKFIWGLFQVTLWIAFGILQLYDNYRFVVEERASALDRKSQDLSKFLIEVVGRDEFTTKLNEQKQEDEEVLELSPEQAQKLLH